MHQWRRRVGPRGQRMRPHQLQIGHIGFRDLRQRAEAEAVWCAAPCQPVAGRRVPQHLVCDRHEVLCRIGRRRPRRQRDIPREGASARRVHPGKLHAHARDHFIISPKHGLARCVPVFVQKQRNKVAVFLVCERAGLSRRHLLPQVVAQSDRRLPGPASLEGAPGKRTRDAVAQRRAVARGAVGVVHDPTLLHLVAREWNRSLSLRGLWRPSLAARGEQKSNGDHGARPKQAFSYLAPWVDLGERQAVV